MAFACRARQPRGIDERHSRDISHSLEAGTARSPEAGFPIGAKPLRGGSASLYHSRRGATLLNVTLIGTRSTKRPLFGTPLLYATLPARDARSVEALAGTPS